jgi:hypothetical protein
MLEVLSIEKKMFTPADFGPPAGYKLSKNDGDLVEFGSSPLSH